MRNNGFAKAEPVNTMDPEYVKLQRAEVLKKYQDQVAELKIQAEELQAKKTALENDLKTAFIAERSKVEDLERLAKEKKEATDREASIVRGLREDFEKERDQKMAEIAFSADELSKTRASLEVTAQAQDKEAERLKSLFSDLDKARAGLQATKEELGQRILELNQDRLALESEQNALKNAQEDQRAMNETIVSRMAELDGLTASCAVAADRVKAQMAEVEAQYAVAREAGREADISIAKLKDLKAETDAACVSVKLERQKLSEWERQLTIREKAFNNDSATRKRDLDDRESRIKSLEAKLGG